MHHSGQPAHILITRPALPARQTCERFETAGFRVSHFALIEITPPPNKAQARRLPQQLLQYEHVIFISDNAVRFGLEFATPTVLQYLNSTHCQVSAIGQKTASSLNNFGVQVDHSPDLGFTSEHLLALPALHNTQIQGSNVLIVRGEGGRELLADTLRSRGAIVDYADVYRRGPPAAEKATAFRQHQSLTDLDMIALTSNEGLLNLLQLFREPALKQCGLLVGSQRIATAARGAGFNGSIITAADPSDAAMLDALLSWSSGKQYDR